jgi:hypothetical protein
MRRAMQLPTAPFTPGTIAFNQSFTLIPASPNTIIQLGTNIASGSSCLYIGGLRQKLGVDYTESAPDQLTLPFVFTSAMIADGQHVTIDFVPM